MTTPTATAPTDPGPHTALRRSAVTSGLRDIMPIIAAVLPFGMVVGVATAGLGIPATQAGIAGLLVFGGSAHLATVSALAGGTAVVSAMLTGVLVNARLLLYSAGMAGEIAQQPRWFRIIGSLTIIDQTYALLPRALEHGRAGLRSYWLAAGAVLVTGWFAALTLGARLGQGLPATIPVSAAPQALFVAMLLPHLGNARTRRAVAVASIVAVVGRGLPAGLGMILALVTAMAVSPPSPDGAQSRRHQRHTTDTHSTLTTRETLPCPS